jgi:GTP cyclohydrolase I
MEQPLEPERAFLQYLEVEKQSSPHTVEVYARRLQLQEQLCAQVADALMEYLAPQGAIVLMEAEHMCMTMRGVQKPGTKTVTLARRGVFETDPSLEERFFRMLGR